MLRRIYSPGLISLIFLPLLCVGYLYKNGWFVQKTMLNVTYYNIAANLRVEKLIHRLPLKPDSFRQYKTIALTGSEKVNDLIFNDLIYKINELNTHEDTIHGYIIQFTDHTKYADVVKALDLWYSYSVGGMIYGDKIYILWTKPYVPAPAIDDGGLFHDDLLVAVKPSPTFPEILLEVISQLQPIWPCFIPFVGMIYFWRKRNERSPVTDLNNYHGNP